MNALHPEFNPNAPLAGNDNSTAGNADLQTRAKLDGRSKVSVRESLIKICSLLVILTDVVA